MIRVLLKQWHVRQRQAMFEKHYQIAHDVVFKSQEIIDSLN